MNTQGWLLMSVSVSSVLMLTAYCLFRVLTLPAVDVEKLHTPQSGDEKVT